MIWYIVIGLFISAFCFITYLAMHTPLMPDDYNEEGIDLDYKNDKDVNDFLNDPANNQEPHEMGDTHEYIKGGLTYDKGEGFKAFQAKQNQATEWVDRDESEYDSSSDGSGEADGGEANDGEEANDANEY